MKRFIVIAFLAAFAFFPGIVSAQGSIVPTGTQHEADLSWKAPSPVGGSGTIAGYNVYRTPSGPPNYTKLNGALVTGLAMVDTTVTAGSAYGYCATTVDSAGTESACTIPVSVNIPTNPAVPAGFVVVAK